MLISLIFKRTWPNGTVGKASKAGTRTWNRKKNWGEKL